MAQWIWKFGEFEVYHHKLVHNRRQQYGHAEPPVWKICPPDTVTRFRKTVTTEGGTFRVKALGNIAVTTGSIPHLNKYGGQDSITLAPGTTEVSVIVSNPDGFPALFIDGVIATDESWEADDLTAAPASPAGTSAWFDSPGKTPDVFPFKYEGISYTQKENINGGTLFDFGKETFAKTEFKFEEDGACSVYFGESREEALDAEWSVIRFTKQTENKKLVLPPYAFRYIFVDRADADVTSEYEYLPLEYRGSFTCADALINKIWETAAYTFHLNSREFFLDGIKRDRWVWAGDAYQSIFVNRYLFFDREIEKRTLTALGGKKPFTGHINTIMDYTFLWLISLYEYYLTYGDEGFLAQIYPQAREVMEFCRSRADADGFVRERKGDWVFIDWARMDKTGALCGEQILFAKALECFAEITALVGGNGDAFAEQARGLQEAVLLYFYDAEKGAFIDSYESGKKNITRHSNILAYLFLDLDEKTKASVYENVILNDSVEQITTPYFKFYENRVHCEAGGAELLEKSIKDYYGAMLSTGATTLYEEFDPAKTGAEHYAMYGSPYEKSLCHAWSASPVYLLGCYRSGVKNTGVAYASFEVRPRLGSLESFSCAVPVPGGSVKVSMDKNHVAVTASVPGGVLVLGGKKIPLPAGVEVKENA